MNLISRQQFLETLNGDWAVFLQRCRRLSPKDQQAYIQRQGYASLEGLLAHVVAWWQDGSQVVQQMRQDPTFQNPSYDVDTFNAQAVERFSGLNEQKMAGLFHKQREVMQALVNDLSDSELADERINSRLYYEIVSHIQEHAIES